MIVLLFFIILRKHNVLTMLSLSRKLFLTLVICVFSISVVLAQRSNCSVAPITNTIKQPDGSQLTITALGNEAVHYLETSGGFTVLKNTSGYFEYATTDANGNLTLSGVVARDNELGKTNAFAPHLRYSKNQQQALAQLHDQLTVSNQQLNKAAGPFPFPSKGQRKLVVLLVEYPDLRATISKENFELLFNQPNYNGTGSFRDFYLATSHGQLDITCTLFGWVMADSNYAYYGKGSSPSYNTATRRLLLSALKAANDSFDVDYSQFDNDKDGFVDGVIILHSGIGAEEQSAPNADNYIWSFRSTLPTSQRPTYDGVQVSAYAMFPEKRYNSGSYSMVGIGVMSHEFGHLLDLPDLYSTQYLNEGAGNYSLMAGGPWLNGEKTPCFNDAWSRIRMGWVEPTLINAADIYKLPYAVVDSDMVFRLNTTQANEYFLLENRQRKGFDSYIPSKGLAIWHINTNLARLLSEGGGNNVNNDTSQLGVGLLQADGLRNLEMNQNRGDASDLFPQNNKNNCTPFTKPNTSLYAKTNGIRNTSNIYITDINQLPDSSIVFEYGINSSAAFGANRYRGCAPMNVQFTSNTVGADSFAWDFGNGNLSNEMLPNKQQSYTKTGSYLVKLNTYNKGVAIDSSSQVVTVLETPEISYGYVRDSSYNLIFTNTTQYGNTFRWIFSTKDTSIYVYEKNPTLSVSGPMKLAVNLNAVSNDGCSKSMQDTIQVFSVGLNNKYNQTIQLNAYPNPVQNNLQLAFMLKEVSIVSVDVFDILGQKVAEMPEISINAGNQLIDVDMSGLKKGIYLIQLNTKQGNAQLKVMKE